MINFFNKNKNSYNIFKISFTIHTNIDNIYYYYSHKT